MSCNMYVNHEPLRMRGAIGGQNQRQQNAQRQQNEHAERHTHRDQFPYLTVSLTWARTVGHRGDGPYGIRSPHAVLVIGGCFTGGVAY